MHQSFTWAADTRLFYGTNGGDREATGVPAAFQFAQKLMRKSQAGQTQSVQFRAALPQSSHIIFNANKSIKDCGQDIFLAAHGSSINPNVQVVDLVASDTVEVFRRFGLVLFTLFRHGGELHSDIRMLFDGGDNWEDLDGTRFDSLQTWRQETAETNTREARNRTAWTYNSMNPKRSRLHSPGGQVYDLYLIEERMRYIMRTYTFTFMSNTKSRSFQTWDSFPKCSMDSVDVLDVLGARGLYGPDPHVVRAGRLRWHSGQCEFAQRNSPPKPQRQ